MRHRAPSRDSGRKIFPALLPVGTTGLPTGKRVVTFPRMEDTEILQIAGHFDVSHGGVQAMIKRAESSDELDPERVLEALGALNEILRRAEQPNTT